jgi:phosphoribosyl 1,2-cyclic phosphodiesterase
MSNSGGSMKIVFWGVRGTIPCPSESHAHFGGNTSCVEVECAGQLFIFDAGSGLRQCGESVSRRGHTKATLLLSHYHHDHMMGLPFFSPAYSASFALKICGVVWNSHRSLKQVVSDYLETPYFPVPLEQLMPGVEFETLSPGHSYEFGAARVSTFGLNHPGGATGYRIDHLDQSVCYITDVEHDVGRQNVDLVAFVKDANVMIYDSTYDDSEFSSHVGWGHSTWQEAVRVGSAAGVKRTVLFHHDPSHDDSVMRRIEGEVSTLPGLVMVAREALRIDL